MPQSTTYLLLVKEQPVERIIAVFPWWITPSTSAQSQPYAEFSIHLAGATQLDDGQLKQAISSIEKHVSDQVSELRFQGALLKESPLFKDLTSQGFTIFQTDRHYAIPAETVIQRTSRIYQKFKHKIPKAWKVESIRGHHPDSIWNIIAEHGLMAHHQFKHYWDSSNSGHFEENFSCVVIEDKAVSGVLLTSKVSDTELHVHIDAVAKKHSSHSQLITMLMKHFFAENSIESFPKTISLRADHEKHIQTQNVALRGGGEELTPRYLLGKTLPF